MRKLFKKVVSVFISLVIVMSAVPSFSLLAFAAQDGDFTYELIDNNVNVSITGYTGVGGDIYLPTGLGYYLSAYLHIH